MFKDLLKECKNFVLEAGISGVATIGTLAFILTISDNLGNLKWKK